MNRVIVVQPGGGEAISGGASVRHVKVDIEGLHLTECSVERLFERFDMRVRG